MMKDLFVDCTLCPRECHVDRTAGQTGYCGQTGELFVARAALHMWEEPCISGKNGSGTVFFVGCSLGCIYCQNHLISKGQMGKKITVERLAEIYLELQQKGAHNINLVTPDHFVPHIIDSIQKARENGLTLPIVYNSSGYVKVETIKLFDQYVDIYLPDMKYMDKSISTKYSGCSDYFEYASKAINEMVTQIGKPVFDRMGIMQRGVIVRHLVLPGCLDDSKRIIRHLKRTFGDSIYISIMNQYTPVSHFKDYPELNRRISQEEYDQLVDYAVSIGVSRGFIQEGDTALESFIPDFNGEGV
jgi:putative pyruvate formate lyase activating enzyme